jgi:hypothetical protein
MTLWSVGNHVPNYMPSHPRLIQSWDISCIVSVLEICLLGQPVFHEDWILNLLTWNRGGKEQMKNNWELLLVLTLSRFNELHVTVSVHVSDIYRRKWCAGVCVGNSVFLHRIELACGKLIIRWDRQWMYCNVHHFQSFRPQVKFIITDSLNVVTATV